MKYVRFAVFVLVALLAILIAVDNRQTVAFSLYPLLAPVEMPLFAVLFVGVLLGVLVGGAVSWWNARHHRRSAKEGRRETARLQGEVATLKASPPVPVEQPR